MDIRLHAGQIQMLACIPFQQATEHVHMILGHILAGSCLRQGQQQGPVPQGWGQPGQPVPVKTFRSPGLLQGRPALLHQIGFVLGQAGGGAGQGLLHPRVDVLGDIGQKHQPNSVSGTSVG